MSVPLRHEAICAFQTIVRAYDDAASLFNAGTATELGIGADVINRAYALYPEDEVRAAERISYNVMTSCSLLHTSFYFTFVMLRLALSVRTHKVSL